MSNRHKMKAILEATGLLGPTKRLLHYAKLSRKAAKFTIVLIRNSKDPGTVQFLWTMIKIAVTSIKKNDLKASATILDWYQSTPDKNAPRLGVFLWFASWRFNWSKFSRIFLRDWQVRNLEISAGLHNSRTSDIGHLAQLAFEALNQGQLELSLKIYLAISKDQGDTDVGFMTRLLTSVSELKKQAVQKATEYKAQFPTDDINVIGSVVWGKSYIQNYLDFFLASILADENLPALNGSKNFLSIVTNANGRDQIVSHPIYEIIKKYIEVEFFIFPENLISHLNHLLPDNLFYRIYGALDHTNYFFAETLDADLFLLPVDSILSNGSLKNLKKLIEKDYDCCGSANLVAELETFLPAIAHLKNGLTLTLETSDLATLAFEHAHQYLKSQLVVPENTNFGRWPRELFWLESDGVVAHSMYVHPLGLSRRIFARDITLTYNNVDAEFVARVFDEPDLFKRVRILSAKEDGVYLNNFAPAGRKFETTGTGFSEQHFLTAHLFSSPVHRYFFSQTQNIPCRLPVRPTPATSSSEEAKQIASTIQNHFAQKESQNV